MTLVWMQYDPLTPVWGSTIERLERLERIPH
jgi:hypothetical protein